MSAQGEIILPAGTALAPEWFLRQPVTAARALLGARLCRRLPDGEIVHWLVCETEAYDGTADRACHASKGLTPRTQVMFGPPGHWYVYLCYGMHWMLNVVTGEKGYPAAVLLRGIVCKGISHDGPGKLTKAVGIDGSWNGKLVAEETSLWLEAGNRIPESAVEIGPRIGVDYAGPEWAGKPWRFVWKRSCRAG